RCVMRFEAVENSDQAGGRQVHEEDRLRHVVPGEEDTIAAAAPAAPLRIARGRAKMMQRAGPADAGEISGIEQANAEILFLHLLHQRLAIAATRRKMSRRTAQAPP